MFSNWIKRSLRRSSLALSGLFFCTARCLCMYAHAYGPGRYLERACNTCTFLNRIQNYNRIFYPCNQTRGGRRWSPRVSGSVSRNRDVWRQVAKCPLSGNNAITEEFHWNRPEDESWTRIVVFLPAETRQIKTPTRPRLEDDRTARIYFDQVVFRNVQKFYRIYRSCI